MNTTETGDRRIRTKILALVGIIGVFFLGLVTLLLHFQPTGYDPLKQAVSDYAVGPYGPEMAAGFFIGGIGVVALALAIYSSNSQRIFKIGSSFLGAAGVALFVLGAFQTDLEGAPATPHGTLHSIVSQFIFSLGPTGMVLVSLGFGRKWFRATIPGTVATTIFALTVQLSLGATGLAERGRILLLLLWWFLASVPVFRMT